MVGEEFNCYIDLAKDGGYVALKREVEDREGWRQRKDVKVCSTTEDYR